MLNQNLLNAEFGFLQDVVFLNAAYVIMPPVRTQRAFHGFMDDYVRTFGEDSVAHAWTLVGEARKELATLLNCSPSEIAFTKNTSEGVGIVANGLSFGNGENVITADLEHSSNLYAWIRQQERGVELRVVASKNGAISLDDIFARMDAKTRVVAISTVQFSTGFRIDLEALGQVCKEKGIVLCVDAIQSAGRLDVDVKRNNISYLACGGNKGLLATLGAGLVYCSSELLERITPPYASYQSTINHVKPPAVTKDFSKLDWHHDARRLESGNLNYAGIAALRAGASLINELGIAAIEKHVLALDARLRKNIEGIRLNVVSFADSRNNSGVVCVYYPADHEKRVIDILHARNIYTTMRGGYIRMAMHAYNTFEHMDTAAEALWEINALSGSPVVAQE